MRDRWHTEEQRPEVNQKELKLKSQTMTDFQTISCHFHFENKAPTFKGPPCRFKQQKPLDALGGFSDGSNIFSQAPQGSMGTYILGVWVAPRTTEAWEILF